MRVLIVAGLLLAGGLAVGAPTSAPMQGTTCWDCHSPGVWTPPMVEPKITEYRFVPEAGSWFVEADVRNTWTHQMRNVSGILETGLHDGVSVLPVGNGTSETFTGTFEASLFQQASRTHALDVPVGAQGLRAVLTPGGLFPHDLMLEVYPPGATAPCPGVVDQPAGRQDTAEFGREDLAAFGPGEWRFVVTTSGDPRDVPEEIDYTLEVETHMDATQSSLAWGGNAGPNETVTLRWPVELGDDGRGTVGLKLVYTSYFDHTGNEPDAELLHLITGVQVTTRDGRPQFTLAEEEEDKDERIPGVPVALLLGLLVVAGASRRRG